MAKRLLFSCLVVLLSACASNPKVVVASKPVVIPPMLKPVAPIWSESNLLSFHDQWKGTPYRLGGLNRNGIDCSGFVYLAYLDIVGDKLPRTVNAQRILGKEVPRNQLIIGDLVFFKTGRTARHVGIYMGQDRFLHASTKKGVKISSLNNIYWKPRFWFAKRLNRPTQQQNISLASRVLYTPQQDD
ncbi:C40 family peptidase [Shewanella livingstonensis]|uniref:Glycoside hydrolase n=1 Tax=Shewanella livingstonensis TaxID=150120 RepID=A0A3G8LNP6_9GAMM|nr:NlpC/P60 family protein [Shewanella livingstonensis]AZG71413.1 glycoside hydrolase [Shewanella livingstonensis]